MTTMNDVSKDKNIEMPRKAYFPTTREPCVGDTSSVYCNWGTDGVENTDSVERKHTHWTGNIEICQIYHRVENKETKGNKKQKWVLERLIRQRYYKTRSEATLTAGNFCKHNWNVVYSGKYHIGNGCVRSIWLKLAVLDYERWSHGVSLN